MFTRLFLCLLISIIVEITGQHHQNAENERFKEAWMLQPENNSYQIRKAETVAVAQEVADSNNNFSMNLYTTLLQTEENKNFVFSPLSLSTLIAMLQAGANGDTLEQIRSTMGFDKLPSEVNTGYKKLQNSLEGSIRKSNATLKTLNRIFIQEDLRIEEEFQYELKEKFNSPAEKIDFSLPEAARRINKIVADNTQQQICDLVDQNDLTNSTRLVALSTLYFQGGWFNAFHGRATKKREFYRLDNENTTVDMMNTEDYFRVADIDFLKAKAIALPFKGKGQEMIILLPNELNGLPSLENILKTRKNAYKQIIESLQQTPKNIVLFLPKFSLHSTLDLKDTLTKMGISNVFDEVRADFTKIAGKNNKLCLSKILQKAFLKVEEAGIEAGAASYGAVFTPLSIGPVIEETILVNHPFMGLIRDVQTDLILFTFRKVE